MYAVNTSSDNSKFRVCETIDKVYSDFPTAIMAQTVFFDLVSGLISTGIAYKFYQAIEITHPIYSIIFQNIVITTCLSYTAFLVNMTDFFIDSCVLSLFGIWLNRGAVFVNIICLVVIAFLRYYFLVSVKNKPYEYIIDMTNVRRVALCFNWSLIMVMYIIKGSIMVHNYLTETNINIDVIFDIILAFAILITTAIVYRVIDVQLRRKQENLDLEKNNTTKENRTQDQSIVSINSELENCKKMKDTRQCQKQLDVGKTILTKN